MISAATWASIVVAVLKVAAMLLSAAQRKGQLEAGEDRAIAEQAVATLKLTAAGKAIMSKIEGMSDVELDAHIDDLGH